MAKETDDKKTNHALTSQQAAQSSQLILANENLLLTPFYSLGMHAEDLARHYLRAMNGRTMPYTAFHHPELIRENALWVLKNMDSPYVPLEKGSSWLAIFNGLAKYNLELLEKIEQLEGPAKTIYHRDLPAKRSFTPQEDQRILEAESGAFRTLASELGIDSTWLRSRQGILLSLGNLATAEG